MGSPLLLTETGPQRRYIADLDSVEGDKSGLDKSFAVYRRHVDEERQKSEVLRFAQE
jgi:hypothetical protein